MIWSKVFELSSPISIQRLLLDAINQLEQLQLFPRDLIITQRISRKNQRLALQRPLQWLPIRSKHLGFSIEMASKVRFVVCQKDKLNPLQRVVLAQECEHLTYPLRSIDVDYYRRLAIRAIWAILGPFGWSEDELLNRSFLRLDHWM